MPQVGTLSGLQAGRTKKLGNEAARGSAEEVDKSLQTLSDKLRRIAESGAGTADKAAAAKIANPPKAKGFKGLLQSFSGSTAGKAVGKTLEVVDLPRAAVVSGLSEVTDLLTDAANLKGHQNLDASWGDFVRQIKEHKGFGAVLHEKAQAEKDAGGNGLGVKLAESKWGARAAGLVGDVGLDPLTYMTFGGKKIAETGGRKAVAREAFKAGEDEIGKKVAQKGISALTEDEIKRISAASGRDFGRGGYTFTLPGTGRVAQRVGLAEAPKEIQVLKQGALRYTPGGLVERAGFSARSSIPGRVVTRVLGGDRTAVKEALLSADSKVVRDAFLAMDASNAGRGAAKVFATDIEREYAQLNYEARKAGVSGVDARLALEGSSEAAAKIEALAPGWLDKARQFTDSMADKANRSAGEDFITKRKNWTANLRTDELHQLLAETQGKVKVERTGASFGESARELEAKLVANGEFLGVGLVAPADSVKIYGRELTPTQQAEEILKDRLATHGVTEVTKMFEPDFFEAMPTIIRGMAHRVGFKRTEVELGKAGVAIDAFKTVKDRTAQAEAARLNRAYRQIGEMAHQQRRFRSLADAKEWGAENVAKRAEVLRNLAESKTARQARQLAGETPKVRGVTDALHAAATELEANAERIGGLSAEISRHADEVARLAANPAADIANQAAQGAALEALALSEAKVNALTRQLDSLNGLRRSTLADGLTEQSNAISDAILSLEGALRTEIDPTVVRAALAESEDRLAAYHRLRDQMHDYLDIMADATSGADGFEGRLAEGLALQEQLGLANVADAQRKLAYLEQHIEPTVQLSRLQRSQLALAERLAVDSPRTALDNARNVLADAARTIQDQTVKRRLTDLAVNTPHVDAGALWNPIDADGHWAVSHAAGAESGANAANLATSQLAGGAERELGITFGQGVGGELGSARAQIRAQNPQMYGLRPDVAPELRYAATGTEATAALAELRIDMVERAWKSGALKPYAMGGDRRSWEAVRKLTDQGTDFRVAVSSVFGQNKVDPLGIGERFADRGAAEVAGALGNDAWALNRAIDKVVGANGTMTAEARTKMATAFRKSLAEDGFDSVMVAGDGGQWLTHVLDDAAVEIGDESTDALMVRYRGLLEEARTRINESADLARQQEGTFGTQIEAALGDLKDARSARHDNRMAWQETLTARGKEGKALRYQERSLRAEADRLYGEAEQLRAQQRLVSGAVRQAQSEVQAAPIKALAEYQEALAQVAELKAGAAKAYADMQRANARQFSSERLARLLEGRLDARAAFKAEAGLEWDEAFERIAMPFGMKQLGKNRYAPHWVVDGLSDMGRVVETQSLKPFWDKFNYVTQLWKSYAIMRPGFHVRNYMGGLFNNWLAGVDRAAYADFARLNSAYSRAVRSGLDHEGAVQVVRKGAKNLDDAERFAAIVEKGIITGGQSTETKIVGEAYRKNLNLNPLSQNFSLFKVNRSASERIENELRGVLALDVMRKGGTAEDALDAVAKYHFDYDDLSAAERQIRKVVPFYTWTRHNIPLQVEMLAQNPKGMMRFIALKRNMEMGTEEESVIPSWYNGELWIRTPFADQPHEGAVGKGQVYWFPDLPFKDLTNTVNPKKLIGMVNPFIKTPIELATNRKTFTGAEFKEGYQPIPSSWTDLGVGAALAAIGRAKRDANGNWVARDKDLYTIEQWIPPLATARRLAPSEDQYKARRATSAMSFAFGVGARTNTSAEISSEVYRRSKALDSKIKDIKSLGYEVPDINDLLTKSEKRQRSRKSSARRISGNTSRSA